MISPPRIAPAALALALLLLLLLCIGCPKPAPVVQQQTFSASAGSLEVVVLVPFYPRPDLARGLTGKGISAEEVAALVTGFFGDALAAEGVHVIPASDLELAFSSQGLATPRRDPPAAAERAARDFGATSVVLGEVYRWRKRSGEALGTDRPASVGFQMSLHQAPGGRRLWTSRFDETQRPLSEDVRNMRRYPGGGSRWLTAAELARWGAAAAAESLVAGQWRASK
jgi:hypothetical protein